MAEKGDESAVNRLLSQPVLDSDAASLYAAFFLLSRDRPTESLSMGLAGGLSLPRPVPRDAIRREGGRLGYDGDALDDFVEAIMRIDDLYVETEVKRAATEAKASVDRARSRR